MSNSNRLWQKISKHGMARAGIAILIILGILSLFAPFLSQYQPTEVDLYAVNQEPSLTYLMGTDNLGRDVFSRCLYGGRVSLAVGFAAVTVSLIGGIIYGSLSGFVGGWLDRIMMSVVDSLLSLPDVLLIVAFYVFLEPGLTSVVLVIGGTSWMQVARLVRTQFISLKQQEFIQAARVLATPGLKIVTRHLLPNCIVPIMVMSIINIGHAIMIESTLSFLGLGIPQHQPSWGNMLMGGQTTLLSGSWWQTVFPGLFIIATVLSINFLGDALRDSLDVRR